MAVPKHIYFVEGIIVAAFVSSPGLLQGKPQICASLIGR
jgi:hypothetical protein